MAVNLNVFHLIHFSVEIFHFCAARVLSSDFIEIAFFFYNFINFQLKGFSTRFQEIFSLFAGFWPCVGEMLVTGFK